MLKEISVAALNCGVAITLSLPRSFSASASLAWRSMTMSASPFSTRLARVAGSGMVWAMMRLKPAGLSGAAPLQSALRFSTTCSPGLNTSTL